MILLLDDHPLTRQGLCCILRKKEPGETFLEAATVHEAITKAQDVPLSMAFIDPYLREESGFEFVTWLRRTGRPAKVFILASFSRPEDFLRARRLGADAYVLKDASLDEIEYGIATVKRGDRFYSAAMVDSLEEPTLPGSGLDSLTQRERQVLELLGKGCGNQQIGEKLYIAEGTVKKHISSILSKLSLKNRVEAVLFMAGHQETWEDAAGIIPVACGQGGKR
ncbi:MAG: response regulator transcription factor [Oscillibacter sp.]|nr:response regulator transcription factor [Oscillibacter sp.]